MPGCFVHTIAMNSLCIMQHCKQRGDILHHSKDVQRLPWLRSPCCQCDTPLCHNEAWQLNMFTSLEAVCCAVVAVQQLWQNTCQRTVLILCHFFFKVCLLDEEPA